MLRLNKLFISALIILGSVSFLGIVKSQAILETQVAQVMNSSQINVKNVKLIPRKDELPPLGITQDLERNIGFAIVFIQLENLKEQKATLLIKTIEIYNYSDGEQQMFKQISQQITLNPLENAEITFQLTNKTGYKGEKQVKARVNYQIEGQDYSIESDAVIVN